MSSSARRDRCVITSARAEQSSTQKSLSETASRLLWQMPSKPSCEAVNCLSMGWVVPARAQAPRGETFMRFAASERRPMSRENIMP